MGKRTVTEPSGGSGSGMFFVRHLATKAIGIGAVGVVLFVAIEASGVGSSVVVNICLSHFGR